MRASEREIEVGREREGGRGREGEGGRGEREGGRGRVGGSERERVRYLRCRESLAPQLEDLT